jgi:uncharacterized damage-inducible protein DinB
MKTDEIRLLYEYNDWVDARFLAACARVSPAQYSQPLRDRVRRTARHNGSPA